MSGAKKLLVFVLSFAVIGGGYYSYSSFAAPKITVRGQAYLIHVDTRQPDKFDDKKSPKSKNRLLVRNEKKNYYIDVDEDADVDIEPGSDIEVTGTLESEEKGIISASTESIVTSTQSSRAPTTQKTLPDQNNIKVAAILVNICSPDGNCPSTNNKITNKQVENALYDDQNDKTVKNFFSRSSYGKTTFSANVYGTYNVNLPNNCDTWALHETVDNLVSKEIDLSKFTNITYVMLSDMGCDSAGFGYYFLPYNYVLGNATDQKLYEQGFTTEVIAHEFGHNFGLLHAGATYCELNKKQVAISNNCKNWEYGDWNDVMGYGFMLFNAINREQLGYLPKDKIITISKSGTYTLSRLDTVNISDSTGLPFAARIKRDNQQATEGKDFYDLEYIDLSKVGEFNNPWVKPRDYSNGLMIRKKSSISEKLNGIKHPPQLISQLIDNNPVKPPKKTPFFADSSLKVGQTFNDTESNIKITTTSINPEGTITFYVDLSK